MSYRIRCLFMVPLGLVLSLTVVAQGEAPSPPKQDPVRVELDRAIAVYRGERTAAADSLASEIRRGRLELPESKMTTAEKVAANKLLKSDLEAFKRDLTLPRSPMLKGAIHSYATRVREAHQSCAKAFDKAAEEYGKSDLKSLELAESILSEKASTLVALPTVDGLVDEESDVKARGKVDRGRYGVELLENPGCEAPLGQDGNLVGWTEIKGNWHRGKPDTRPASGTGYFSASNLTKGGRGNALAQLEQAVDISAYANAIDRGGVSAQLAFKVSSFRQPPGDKTRVLMVFRDAMGATTGEGYDSGELVSVGAWSSKRVVLKVPAKARTMTVALQSVRDARGRQTSNDGHFDDLSLRLTRGY